jgi:hypothetical protein
LIVILKQESNMSDFQPFSDRNGNFKLPPNTDFRAVFFANAAFRQEVKLYIGDSSTPAWTYAGRLWCK